MGRPGPTEQNVALGELLRALPSVLAGHSVDTILITGDIAYSGTQAQYAAFTTSVLEPLRGLGECAAAQIIAVPGNHDLCHGKSSLPVMWDSLGGNRQAEFFEESADGVETRRTRAALFEHYAAFLRDNAIAGPDPLRQVSCAITLVRPPHEVCFIATNTALFSDKDTSDEHKVPYPDVSLRALLQRATAATHVFVLGHHPVEWFLPRTRNQFYQLLSTYRAVYLHGHLHEIGTKCDPRGLVTMGFGAAYQGPLTGPPTPVYRNTFCVCELENEALHVAPYDWDAENGRWVPASNLPPDIQDRSRVLDNGWSLPIRKHAASPVLGLGVRALPRNTPSKLNHLGTLDHADWLALIDRVQLADRAVLHESRQIEHDLRSGRPALRFHCTNGTHYAECIGAPGHSISVAEIQDLNARLDIEGYLSYTLVSLGVFADDAHALYLRLKEHKPIFIYSGNDIAQQIGQLPVFASTLRTIDSSVAECDFTVATGGRILLIVRDTIGAGAFHVVDAHGACLEPSDPQVVALRMHRADLAKVPYRTAVASIAAAPARIAFDRTAYLTACRRVFNDVRYAPLAAIGFRLPEISLDELYVQTRAVLGQGRVQSFRVFRVFDAMLQDTRLDGPFAEEARQQFAQDVELAGEDIHDSAPRFYQQYGSITVLGDPGSGKTFFAQHEILTYTEPTPPSWYARHTPLFIPLAELATRFDPQSGVLAVAAQIAEIQGLPIREPDLVDLLGKGLLALFFDGLDEIVSVELRARVLDAVRALVEIALPIGNRFILTSRPASVHGIELPRGLEVISMKGLSREDIRALASRLLNASLTESSLAPRGPRDPEAVVDGLLSDIEKTPGIAGLAQNPLFLTLLVMIYVNTGVPSAHRHRLYQQAVQTLVAVRTRQAGQRGLSEADLRVRLGAIAFAIFCDPQALLPTKGQLAMQVARIMASERGAAVAAREASQWLHDVAESTGLLVFHTHHQDDQLSLVSFMHHSFLEFYAAHGLLAAEHRGHLARLARVPRWREVLTLAGGIVGESADLYPLIDIVLNLDEPGDHVTMESAILAFDCTLENEIPPERVIRALLSRLDERVRSGPLRRDWALRGDVGNRLGRLLMSSGSPLIARFLIAGLGDPDEDVRVAYLDLTGYAGAYARLSPEIVAAATGAAAASAPQMQRALCNAVARAPELQTPALLDRVTAALDGNSQVRLKAIETMTALPGLALRAWDLLARIVRFDQSPHCEEAARAILQAGFKIDTTDSEYSRVVLESLRRVIDATSREMPSHLAIRYKVSEVSALLTSPNPTSRLLGLRLVIWVSDDDTFVYRSIMQVLRSPRASHEEMAAALGSLRQSARSYKLVRRADAEMLCALLANPHRDVRVNAARLLGELAPRDPHPDELETRALIGYAAGKRGTREYDPAIRAVGRVAVASDLARLFLFGECERLLRKPSLSDDEVTELEDVLRQLNTSERPTPESVIHGLKEQVRNHQITARTRCFALQAITMLAPIDGLTLDWLLQTMANPPGGTASSVPMTALIFVSRCGRRLEHILDMRPSLPRLRDAVLAYHARVMSLTPESAEEIIYDVRKTLETIHHMTSSYDEFMQPSQGAPAAPG